MRVGEIRVLIEGKSDEELLFVPWFDKDEGNELIQNNILEDTECSEADYLTEDEWKLIVDKLGNDDGIWQELNETFYHYVNQVVENRRKGKK